MLVPLTCTHAVHGEVFQLVELNDLADGCALLLLVFRCFLVVATDALHDLFPFGVFTSFRVDLLIVDCHSSDSRCDDGGKRREIS